MMCLFQDVNLRRAIANPFIDKHNSLAALAIQQAGWRAAL